MNKDGYDDIIIGAIYSAPQGRSFAGECYVIYGGLALPSLNLTNLIESQGFSITGVTGAQTGFSVSGGGDVNNDGYSDVVIGSGANRAYVIWGGPSLTNLDLGSLSASQGVMLQGTAGENCGISVALPGDINKDGYDDIVIGSTSESQVGRRLCGLWEFQPNKLEPRKYSYISRF